MYNPVTLSSATRGDDDDDEESGMAVEFHFDEDNNNDGVSSNNTTSANVHRDSQFLYDKQDKWRIDLMKILNDMQAPDYAMQEVLQWAANANREGLDFNKERGFSRQSNLK